MESPFRRISPDSYGSRLAMTLRAVDFPEPLGPLKKRIWFGLRVRLKLMRTGLEPWDLNIERTSSIVMSRVAKRMHGSLARWHTRSLLMTLSTSTSAAG